MKRSLQWILTSLILLLVSISLALGIWHLIDRNPRVAKVVPFANQFNGSLVVLADADMAATAYADANLHPIAGTSDQLIHLKQLEQDNPEKYSLAVSNSVMGWPGSMTLSNTKDYAYVIETKGQIERTIKSLENDVHTDIPAGQRLSIIDLNTGIISAEISVCQNPLSVDIAPDDTWLLIACNDAQAELMIVSLMNGLAQETRVFDLEVPSYSQRPQDQGASFAVIHPTAEVAAVILQSQAISLVRFELDEEGVPLSASAEAPQETKNRWLSVARWTQAGHHLLVADVAWGARPIDSVINRKGGILSYALSPRRSERGLVSEAKTSLSPEAFELNDDGNLLAVVNMERTYLPNSFLRIVPRRSNSSLSLIAVDDSTGSLSVLGKPVGFKGVLPEDAAFDEDSDQIAVVVYQNHNDPTSNGWLSFFDIDYSQEVPQLILTDKRIDLPRGAHDLMRY